MKYAILQYLRDHKRQRGRGLSIFIQARFPDEPCWLVKDTIVALHFDGYIIGYEEGQFEVFPPSADSNVNMADFNGTIIELKITGAGERRLSELELESQLRRVNEASIRVSDSTLAANAFQRRLSRITVCVALASLIAIIVSAIIAFYGVGSKDIDKLRGQLEQNKRALDSIVQYQQGMDWSLKKIASDTSRADHVNQPKYR